MFIEVTDTVTREKTLINTENIVGIFSSKNLSKYSGNPIAKNTNTIISNVRDYIECEESYEEIKDMITRVPVIVNTGTGEIDQLYDDADKGICSNHSVEPLKVEFPEKVDWSKLSDKLSLIDVHEKSPYDSQVEEITHTMSDEEKEKLHEFSLKILRSTGIPLKYLTGRDEI